MLCSGNLWSQYHFEMTPDMKEAYTYAMSLRKQDALDKIAVIKRSDPYNLLVLHVENYIDFFDIFIKEEEDVFSTLKKNKDTRIDLLKSSDVQSPFTRFVIAEINLQWALARAKFNENLTAARELYRAYQLLEDNEKLYPDFHLNKKSLSIMHALAESVPGFVRKVFGVRGSIQQGTDEILALTQLDREEVSIFYDEITAIYSYILLFQNNKKREAWNFVISRDIDIDHNPLACFLVASIAAKNGHNDEVIRVLENRPTDDSYESFYYLDFLLGKAKLYNLEQGADTHIHQFLQNFQGAHYIKEAYQKLAWYHLVMNDDYLSYKKYMQRCKDYGHTLVDEDKQAHREAKLKESPNPDLLKARLLFDGGYYQRAYTQLITKSYLFHEGSPEYLEYNYRLGRISQALGNLTDAITYYGYTINIGHETKSYYPCNAALQIGLIFESQKKYKRALRYLNICLKINPDEYKDSLYQKAKTAKERIQELQ